MNYSFDTGISISSELHQLALEEFQYVSSDPEFKTMDYSNERDRIYQALTMFPHWGGKEILESFSNPVCNLEGFRTRPEFEQAVLEHFPIVSTIGRKFWIRLQRVSGGVWFPYHCDEVKTGGLFVGLQHHNEKTRFWSESTPTPIAAKALSNLKFEQEICVKDKEVWIFDHHAVHSVHDCDPKTPRITMTIAFEGLRPQDLTQFFL